MPGPDCKRMKSQPVEKIFVEFIGDPMSLAEHQFTPRR
jgi:hypothetical protein